VAKAAKEHGVWVSMGVHEMGEEKRCWNTNVLVDAQGEVRERYRKVRRAASRRRARRIGSRGSLVPVWLRPLSSAAPLRRGHRRWPQDSRVGDHDPRQAAASRRSLAPRTDRRESCV
jgi:hypothetical protein